MVPWVRHAPKVRRKPLDQCGRAPTYWYGNRSLLPQISYLPASHSSRGSVTAVESVPDVFDIFTIIFLALGVFIFLRLRSVLGQRTGRERPPYDPYSARDAVRGATNDNVVTLPGRAADTAQKPV